MKKRAQVIYLVFTITSPMGRKVIAIWLCLTMLLGMIVIVDVTMDFTVKVRGATLYVNTTGSGGAYTSIQDAINDSIDGDTVFVYNGTYIENVIVNKTINLTGEDKNNTKIDGGGSGNVVYVNVNWVNITGFTITNGTYGMWFDSSSNSSITNNNVISNRGLPAGYGIVFGPSSNNSIINNNVLNNGNGIYLGLSSNSIIAGNEISSNDDTGIWFDGLSDSTVTNNNISINGWYGMAFAWASNNTITGNNASSNDQYGIYLSSSSNNTITGNNASSNEPYGIYLSSSSNTTVTGNNVSHNEYGIVFWSSSRNSIMDNDVLNNGWGIALYSSSNNNKIYDNNVSNNAWGIECDTSSNNNLTNNNVSSSSVWGIVLFSSNNHYINNNTLFKDGISLWGDQLSHYNSHAIQINNMANGKPIRYYKDSGNFMVDGIQMGQLIIANCTNLTAKNLQINETEVAVTIAFSAKIEITQNSIFNNRYGIDLESSSNNSVTSNNITSNSWWGIRLSSSFDNRIYHNNIINNIGQATDDTDYNLWNDTYPSGGNYWSDYGGIDKYKGPNQNIPGSDGIGDTYYPIFDGNNEDNYPLMEPYKSLENYTALKQGWNLISIPLIQEERNLTRVLGTIDGSYDAVQWHDPTDTNDPWKHHKVCKQFGNDLFELNETMGFWIHITQPGDTIFLYNGTQPTQNQTIQLHEGWNIVGYPSLSSYNRTEGLNNLTFNTHVNAIWTYNAATQKYKQLTESDYFEIGKGYYIHTKAECTWAVPL
jgi:parallel beta-helix repeat protein